MLRAYRTKEIAPAAPQAKKSPALWCGWRKQRGGAFGFWEHVKEADSPTKADCLTKLVELSELKVGELGNYTYLILPEKEVPPR